MHAWGVHQPIVHLRSRQLVPFVNNIPQPCFGRADQRRARRQPSLVVKADMNSIVDSVITYGALSVSLGATMYAVFYNWPRSKPPAPLTSSEDNFTWAVMGAVSCLPLFNSMAWVLGALQSDNPRPYYWAAALYALPLLRNGFDQDWFSWTLLLLGVAHVQALRVAATEPELQAKLQQQLKPFALISTVANAAGQAAGAAIGTPLIGSSRQGLQQQQQQQLGAGDSSTSLDQLLGKDVLDKEDKEEVLRQLELQDFDRRLQDRSSQQRQQHD